MEAQGTTDEQGLPIRPLPDGSDIRKLSEDEIPRAAAILAGAFYDDPVVGHWLVPDESKRMRRLERVFELFARRFWWPPGEGIVTDRLFGAAFWMPPGSAETTTFQDLAMMPPSALIMRGDFLRLVPFLNALDKAHPHDPPHYYLPVIGVEPEWQGRGFGAALLRPILERCDSERIPAYLEATSPRNRALYEANGFEVREEKTVRDSPPFWPMWREPRS